MKKILTYIKRVAEYVLRAVLEKIRRDVGGKQDSEGKESL